MTQDDDIAMLAKQLAELTAEVASLTKKVEGLVSRMFRARPSRSRSRSASTTPLSSYLRYPVGSRMRRTLSGQRSESGTRRPGFS